MLGVVEQMTAALVESLATVAPEPLIPDDPVLSMQTGLAKHEPERVRIPVVDQHPQRSIIRQPVCARLHPPSTPRQVPIVRELVCRRAGAIVNAEIVRWVGENQTSQRQ